MTISPPFLSSPPALVLLLLVFAIAAYLGQVHQAANHLYIQIRGGHEPGYPIGEEYTAAKLQSLDATRRNVAKGEAWLERLAVTLGFRFAFQAGAGLAESFGLPVPWADPFFRFLDFGIMALLFTLLVILARIRKEARARDERITGLLEAHLAGRGAAPNLSPEPR